MKKLFLLILAFLPISILSQSWETPIQTTLPANIVTDSDFRYRFNIDADNYGMHFIAQCTDYPNMIKYRLVSNTGEILQSIDNINTTSGSKASSICTYNGFVFVAIVDNSSPNKMILFAKPNSYPYSNFTDVGEYTINTSEIRYIDMCADNYGIHIIFSENFPTTNGAGIYYLNYKLETAWWASYNMIIVAENPPSGGWAGKVTTSNVDGLERVHVSYGAGHEFYTRDIRIYRPDSYGLDNAQLTGSWGQYYDEAAWGTPAIDPRPNGNMYELGMLYLEQGSHASKLKWKQIGSGYNWTDDYLTNTTPFADHQYPESMFYDDYYQNGGFMSIMYGDQAYPPLQPQSVYQRYYNISANPPQFETPTEVFHGTSGHNFSSGVMKPSRQGVYAVAITDESPYQFWMSRQPRIIKNDIVNNALWTGNTYIGSQNPIHTAGAMVNALNYSFTQLLNGAYFVIDNFNTVNLYKSTVNSQNNTTIYVQQVGRLCNYSSTFTGQTHIVYQGQYRCAELQQVDMMDSSQIELLGDAVWQLEDNSVVTVEGPYCVLKMNPNSTIKFGQNSKLILNNGARLIADHATFTSLDPSSTWDGIYLYDISHDTITNCTIENAANGVNIKNKYSFTGNQPSTEISNCTFSNTTNTQLTNGIYASASNNVLIRNNNFTSSSLIDAFANGIMLEYCPAGAFDIIDNHLDKVHSGIAVIQSSPYIARNTITGLTSDGDGIYLDNSNGTVKYNNTYYSNHSLIAYYSSPYLLKNNFNNASDINIDLHSNSVPVMRPINSGTTLRWLAGNNLINGSPLTCGISFNEESYPSMDSGYNKLTVNGSNYMNGVLPSLFTANLPASYNYWGETPNPQKYSVTPYSVDYNPTFDGSTVPPTNYIELNDIGFGLYDTVYVENLGDNPGAEILFMQAYNKEMEAQYVLAISLYKQVILNYRRSDYAPVSLSRIFNCFEKRISSISDYQLLQNYMNQLRINSNYPAGVKELAEDFMIKSKVRQGLLNAAISDYQLIYQQNQNNSKGLHALINKECLIAMKSDTTDNPSQSNTSGITQHKLRLLSLIIGRNLTGSDRVTNSNTPKEFKLYQNYPNPFNPSTTIKYDLPKSGNVSIKVYDLLGKEIYSMNEFKLAGSYNIKFDGSNHASGVYFYKIEASSFTDTKKMVLIK
jgi:hypothetical protein